MQRQKTCQHPHVQRRMGMPAHIYAIAEVDILGMIRMRRVDLRMLRPGQVVDVVPLNRLIQKRKAQQQYDGQHQQRLSPST